MAGGQGSTYKLSGLMDSLLPREINVWQPTLLNCSKDTASAERSLALDTRKMKGRISGSSNSFHLMFLLERKLFMLATELLFLHRHSKSKPKYATRLPTWAQYMHSAGCKSWIQLAGGGGQSS